MASDQPVIKQAYPTLSPNPLGGMGLAIYGLGEDSKMYVWTGEKWISAK